jgi:hypothetical protein
MFTSEKGVKGALPACCIPLWGREGVTLITGVKYSQQFEKIVFLQGQLLIFLNDLNLNT